MVHTWRRPSGFTLVEILVSLVVISVGISILVSLFTSSLSLSQASRNQQTAASLAEEEMRALLQDPGAYDWGLEKVQAGQLAKVQVRGKPADSYPIEPPTVLPAERTASSHETNFYDKFTWRALAKLPAPDAAYVEVTVAIQWVEYGRERAFTLTSGIPRASIKAGGAPVQEGTT